MKSLDNDLLNEGLAMAMEFGDHWLEPIQKRLSQKHPELSGELLDQYDKTCRRVMDEGHKLVTSTLRGMKKETFDQKDASMKVKSEISKRHPWVSSENMSQLISQGFYYAYKEGYR